MGQRNAPPGGDSNLLNLLVSLRLPLFVTKFSPFVVVIYIFLYRFKITRFPAICSSVLDVILVLLLFHIRLIFEREY